MTDPIDFGKQIGGLIREAIAPLQRDLTDLRERAPEKGDPGQDAEPVDIGALADLVVAKLLDSPRLLTLVDMATVDAVSKHFEANPVLNGRDADPAVIEATVRAAVDALPTPRDGRDGEQVTEQQLAAAVAKHLAENPPQAGAAGVGLAGAMIDRAGELVITTTRGEAVRLGRVVGEDGKDGQNGISFDTAAGEYDAARGFVITLGAGDRRAELVLPYMVHRGFWREGLGVKAGESITHDGALWIAKRANASKPCLEHCDDWQLAARKGRDGKDGRSPPGSARPIKLGGGNG